MVATSKRMAGADQRCGRRPLRGAKGFIKTNPFIALQHRFAETNLHIPVAHGKGHGGDFITSVLARRI
ncbi:hypothetical protein AGMMS49974_09870 [Deltaproteobacteria bacterium]|nr:hypothetical protein AGMMS49974_09870 [Deltaproteobacteria bacterium]